MINIDTTLVHEQAYESPLASSSCQKQQKENNTMPAGYATVEEVLPNKQSGDDTITNNKYDVVEQCNMTSSADLAVSHPQATDKPVYSESSNTPIARENEEVYNVAYPVVTPQSSENEIIDGYECLSYMKS